MKKRERDVSWVVCFNKNNQKILLGKRSDKVKNPNQWGLPGGHLNKNEKPKSAASRECEEETGKSTELSELSKIGTFTTKKGKKHHFYLYIIDKKFDAESIDDETSLFKWCKLSNLKTKNDLDLHKSTKIFIYNISQSEKFKKLIKNKEKFNLLTVSLRRFKEIA